MNVTARLRRKLEGFVDGRVERARTVPGYWESLGDRLVMGRHSYGVPKIRHYPGDDPDRRVIIGNYVSIGEDVELLIGGIHPLERTSTYPFRMRWELPGAGQDGHPTSNGDIVIGSDVWVARQSRILSGVTVGDGAVIAHSALVTRDVRPFAIVGGNPARELRRRFDDETVDRLLAIRWWDWPDDRVREAVPYLTAGPREFLEWAEEVSS